MAQQVYTAIVPSDVTVYAPALSAIWVGTAGAIAVLGLKDANPVTLPNVPVGFLNFPWPVSKIMATGTAASNIIGAQAGGS